VAAVGTSEFLGLSVQRRITQLHKEVGGGLKEMVVAYHEAGELHHYKWGEPRTSAVTTTRIIAMC
jgi:hypothetical protein